MTPEAYYALIALAVATLFTPGPNNAMLASSGARFGFWPTTPHMLGVAVGFPVMLLIVGLLLGEVFKSSDLLRESLRWGGAALLLWIAWKTANAGGLSEKSSGGSPMTFVGASAFQWINPKGWSMAVAATTQFITPERPVQTAVIVAATFLTFGLASSATWVGLGQAIGRWLTTDGRQRVFNLTMAGLIVLSVAAVIRH
ncbi:MAG: LysE family translocator [Proteobacteria bacterium]|nr:LysE family translocator [Pseudomonadota bacterium]